MYKDLKIEVGKMWKVRTKIVPVITGALRTIKKGSDKNLQLLSSHLSFIKLQIKQMNTAHIIRKVLG